MSMMSTVYINSLGSADEGESKRAVSELNYRLEFSNLVFMAANRMPRGLNPNGGLPINYVRDSSIRRNTDG